MLADLVEKLEKVVENCKGFAESLESGTKKASGELRKEAQEGKKILQEIRVEALNILKSLPTKKREKKAE